MFRLFTDEELVDDIGYVGRPSPASTIARHQRRAEARKKRTRNNLRIRQSKARRKEK